MLYYVYICSDRRNRRWYVGHTKDPDKRATAHLYQESKAAKATKTHLFDQVELVYEARSIEEARYMERVVYYRLRELHGKDCVRGAGNTRPWAWI